MTTDEHGKPPVFKHWGGWYWLVGIVLLVQIVIYYALTISLQ